MKHLLITNDDGISSPGLAALAEAFGAVGIATVCAPQGNCSGVSQALTLNRPLGVERRTLAGSTRPAHTGFAVDGTPADCVHIALNGGLDCQPSSVFTGVVSGINHGSNLGEDVLYSGTVGAAREANLAGLNSMAISLVTAAGDAALHWQTAAHIARLVWSAYEDAAGTAAAPTAQAPWFINVNVPNLPLHSLRGIKLAQLSTRGQSRGLVHCVSPRGARMVWIGEFGLPVLGKVGANTPQQVPTDARCVADQYVSLTPLLRHGIDPNAGRHQALVEALHLQNHAN